MCTLCFIKFYLQNDPKEINRNDPVKIVPWTLSARKSTVKQTGREMSPLCVFMEYAFENTQYNYGMA